MKILKYVLFLLLIFLIISCSTKDPNKSLDTNQYSELDQLKIIYPELYLELLKLPDLKVKSEKNRTALTQIVSLGLSNENKNIFEMILNEGLKTKRKYCTPLEALLWLSYDRDFDEKNPLSYYSLNSLLSKAWTATSTSNNFSSERWKDLNEVADRLNSPEIITFYMEQRFYYSHEKGEFEGVKSVETLFKEGTGACYDYALFASYFLKKNGYDKAWGMAVKYDQLLDNFYGGHVGNIYQDPKDDLYYSMDFNSNDYAISGPFDTINDTAIHICYIGSSGAANLKSYKMYKVNLYNGKYIKVLPYF